METWASIESLDGREFCLSSIFEHCWFRCRSSRPTRVWPSGRLTRKKKKKMLVASCAYVRGSSCYVKFQAESLSIFRGISRIRSMGEKCISRRGSSWPVIRVGSIKFLRITSHPTCASVRSHNANVSWPPRGSTFHNSFHFYESKKIHPIYREQQTRNLLFPRVSSQTRCRQLYTIE